MKLGVQMLSVDVIDEDESIQARASIDQDLVSTYAEDMRNGKRFPSIVVFYDGQIYRIADGNHRYRAVIANNGTEVEADVCEGGRLEALLHAIGSNTNHGLRRSNKDKRHTIGLALAEPACADWSDREIARRCGVSHAMVADVRRPSPADDSGRIFHSPSAVGGGTAQIQPAAEWKNRVASSTATAGASWNNTPSASTPPPADDPINLVAEVERTFERACQLGDLALESPRARALLGVAISDTEAWLKRAARIVAKGAAA